MAHYYEQAIDFITDPSFKKTSDMFQYDTTMDDSDCSEYYDSDKFFEGNQRKKVCSAAEYQDQLKIGIALGEINHGA